MNTTRDAMWIIWGLVVKHLHKMLTDDSGQLKPSMYAVIIKFLKDNGVTMTSYKTDKLSGEMEKLLEGLPSYEDGEAKQ